MPTACPQKRSGANTASPSLSLGEDTASVAASTLIREKSDLFVGTGDQLDLQCHIANCVES
jgi:hypothetical protein